MPANVPPALTILVDAAEALFGAGSGEQKKEWVVEQINKYVDLPFIPEDVEEEVFNLIVDVIIEFVVSITVNYGKQK